MLTTGNQSPQAAGPGVVKAPGHAWPSSTSMNRCSVHPAFAESTGEIGWPAAGSPPGLRIMLTNDVYVLVDGELHETALGTIDLGDGTHCLFTSPQNILVRLP